MPAVKPRLEKLATPLTATFPSEVASAATATPRSAVHLAFKPDPDFIKTPISPPLAYTDFLSKAMSLHSPAILSPGETTPSSPLRSSSMDKCKQSRADERQAEDDERGQRGQDGDKDDKDDKEVKDDKEDKEDKDDKDDNDDDDKDDNDNDDDDQQVDNGADDGDAKSFTSSKPTPSTTASFSSLPKSPYPSSVPRSAPPVGAASFPSLKLPPSPAFSSLDSPLSASFAKSPFSARAVRSVFDWDAALKARFADSKAQKSVRTSVRHIREVVTRTVTYTPRMEPAPRGKRRKVE
ncbi:hypothetical protein CDD82_6848 [Ophiocordyceps australis]|uniref:Uncharacterized protein n=1 Tax=Ophiocordyceps australis TaxID=1399860 RepID=A0A2C5XFW4_9HYPO|nr:hypothetical protein CDD82_6848 [Ophiocordyceps australis]